MNRILRIDPLPIPPVIANAEYAEAKMDEWITDLQYTRIEHTWKDIWLNDWQFQPGALVVMERTPKELKEWLFERCREWAKKNK